MPNATGVVKQIWDSLNNRQRVSANVLEESSVRILKDNPEVGRHVIIVIVPRADRKRRPVFVGSNPFGGTYRRNFEGDYRCDDETVKRMLADQVQDSRDATIAEKFSLEDLDIESVRSYRNQFATASPDHPYLGLDDKTFLQRVGAWGVDRENKNEGPTNAGLLMLGRSDTIPEIYPNYFVDYQQRPEAKAEPRWIDRLVPDGSWSGNLYEFYRRVSQKLYQDLRVPFRLQNGVSVRETPVHEALREALTNCLIHADYTGNVSVLVVKRPDMFGFRNPGSMRVPLHEALAGGVSDCRNRNLQLMFRFIGAGEQAGSGIPRIDKNWAGQHWRAPIWRERFDDAEQTILELRMLSLLPDVTLEDLDARFGDRFRQLEEPHRLALATVQIEGEVSHGRLNQITDLHSSDVSKVLYSLVKDGFLESEGASRGTVYHFPGGGGRVVGFDQNSPPSEIRISLPLEGSSLPLEGSSLPLEGSSLPLEGSSQQKGIGGLETVTLGSPLWERAEQLAQPVKSKKKAARMEVQTAILEITGLGFVTMGGLASLLNRHPVVLQSRFVKEMLNEGLLEMRYPETPNHPRQAYTASRQPR